MPRRNSNAIGKPQGKKKQKSQHPEQVEYKPMSIDAKVQDRISPESLTALNLFKQEVFGK